MALVSHKKRVAQYVFHDVWKSLIFSRCLDLGVFGIDKNLKDYEIILQMRFQKTL